VQGILLLLCLLGSSCNNEIDSGEISEGEIEFHVNYLENGENNLFIALLPSKVTTYFRENSSCTLIEGDLGLFKLAFILNGEVQKNYSLLQIIDKKYVYKSKFGETTYGYAQMDGLKIIYSEKRKKIANYNCKHAMAVYNELKDTIQLYYTNEIDLLHPNLNNPFKEIDGVLMEFSVTLAGIDMQFKANKVQSIKVEPSLFTLPEGYLSISEKQMKEEINKYYYSADK